MYRIDYSTEENRIYVDLRDLDSLLTALEVNPRFAVDYKTIELVKGIIASFIQTIESGATEELVLKINDKQILEIQKRVFTGISKKDKLLMKQVKRNKKKALEEAKNHPISPDLKIVEPEEEEEEELEDEDFEEEG